MKLLTKSSIYFSLFLLIILIVGSFGLYYMFRSLVYEEVDEWLVREKNLIKQNYDFSDSLDLKLLTKRTDLILYSLEITGSTPEETFSDTLIYLPEDEEYAPSRQLKFSVITNEKAYLITLRKSLLESEDLVENISITMILIIVSSLLFLLFANLYGQQILWKPFNLILERMKKYDFREDVPLDPVESNTLEFRELNDGLQKFTGKLRQDYQALKRFTEDAAHEMQTPVSTIITNLEMYQQADSPNEERQNNISTAYRAALKLSKLNQALTLLTRVDNKEYNVKKKINLNEKIKILLEEIREMAETRLISIETTFDTGIHVEINEDLLEILLKNLLYNGVKHNIENGFIKITTSGQSLTIENSGNQFDGNPEELFNRFRKADGSSASLGLGLSIVKQICDLEQISINYSIDGKTHIVSLTFTNLHE
ncbi:sensor histidine kinase [Calditrichota bacterium]